MVTKYETFDDELDAIRLAIYEEIKDMTMEEKAVYFRSHEEAFAKEHGIRTVSLEQMKAEQRAEREAVLS